MRKLILLLSVLLPVYSYSEEPIERYEREMQSYKTTFSFFVKNNIGKNTIGYVEERFNRQLVTIPNLAFNGDIEYPYKSFNEKTAFEYFTKNNENKSGRVILGFVRYEELKRNTPLGSSGSEKYLMAKTNVKKVYFDVYLIDINEQKVILSLKKECYYTNAEIRNAITYFVIKIAEYYPDIEKPLITVKPEPQEQYRIYYHTGVSAALPFTKFLNISYVGIGVNAGFSVEDKWKKNLVFGIDFTPSLGITDNKLIEQYYFMPIALNCGYLFNVNSYFQFVPSAGAGYIFHFVKSDTLDIYYDPLLKAQLELRYKITENYQLYANTGFTTFFEQVHVGYYACINLGMRGRIK